MRRPPTVTQLLVLADRAERGPLTAAEASRLREGITNLRESRRSAVGRRSAATRARRQGAAQLAAVRALVASARQRGARSVPVWILAAALDGTPEVRQREANAA